MHVQLWASLLLLGACCLALSTAGRSTKLRHTTSLADDGQLAYQKYEIIQGGFPDHVFQLMGKVKANAKAARTTTTQRPFVRVWNSFLRSVQPNFGLRNFTNPLVNFFNNGNSNIIETLPVEAEMLDNEHSVADQEFSSAASTHNANNRRKRKRRKQVKRKPVYESQEQDDPYDYYRQLYNPYEYYGMRPYALPPNYYDSYLEEPLGEDDVGQLLSDESRSRFNTKKTFAALRPISLTIKMTSEGETKTDQLLDDTVANVNPDEAYVVVGFNSEDSAAPTAANAPTDDQSALSESVRNAFGSYMHDDRLSRERQRQSDREQDIGDPVKAEPRHQHYLFAARLVKNRQ